MADALELGLDIGESTTSPSSRPVMSSTTPSEKNHSSGSSSIFIAGSPRIVLL